MKCLAKGITACSGRQEFNYCSKHYQQVRRHGKIIISSRDRRPVIIEGNTARIPLGVNAKDGYAIVDKKYAYLAKDNWRITHYGYAIRSKDKKLLHRLIVNTSKGRVIDHINGNTLDNRLTNLRECTQSDNAKNQKLNIRNKTGYKGVYFDKRYKKYIASVNSNYKKIHAGVYLTAEEAAKAYNKLALELHGEFARLNDVR